MTLHTLLRAALPLALITSCTQNTDDNFPNPPPGPPATCSVAAVDGCSSDAQGYSCTTADAPDLTDTNLVCSKGVGLSDGTTQYCCLPFAQSFSECMADRTLAGCDAPSIGFSCGGATAPDEADSALTCVAGPTSGEVATYCCLAK